MTDLIQMIENKARLIAEEQEARHASAVALLQPVVDDIQRILDRWPQLGLKVQIIESPIRPGLPRIALSDNGEDVLFVLIGNPAMETYRAVRAGLHRGDRGDFAFGNRAELLSQLANRYFANLVAALPPAGKGERRAQ